MKISREKTTVNRIIPGLLGVIILLGTMIGSSTFVSAEVVKPEVDMKQKAEISVLLEDDSRFMGVNVYRIGEYEGEVFKYLPEYRALVDKDYYALDTVKQKDESISIISEYIKGSKDILPETSILIEKGTGKSKEIPLGLYLIIQNDGDHNAELEKAIVTEAPLYDEEQNIYLYDIYLYPKWERTIWFSFRPEVVYPLEIVFLLGICVLLCLFSTRLVRTLFFLATFLLAGLLGMLIGTRITTEFVWLMGIFVSLAFLGVGLLWMLLGILGGIVKKSQFFNSISKHMIWIIPILAGIAGGFIVYRYITKEWLFYLVIPAAVVVIGEIVQYLRRGKDVVYRTYENLLDLEILPIDEDDENSGENEEGTYEIETVSNTDLAKSNETSTIKGE